MTFGALGGFTGGWMAWLQAVTIAPIEVEATLGYLDAKFTGLNLIKANGTLDSKGFLIGAGFLLVFSVINTLGVRWLAETNSIAMVWKSSIPILTIIALLFTVFHLSNFTAGGGLPPTASTASSRHFRSGSSLRSRDSSRPYRSAARPRIRSGTSPGR